MFRKKERDKVVKDELHSSQLVAQEAARKTLTKLGYEGSLIGSLAKFLLYPVEAAEASFVEEGTR